MKNGRIIFVRILILLAAVVYIVPSIRYLSGSKDIVTSLLLTMLFETPFYVLLMIGTFKPLFYGLGLTIYSVGSVVLDLIFGGGPSWSTSYILGILSVLPISILLLIPGIHYLSKGRRISGNTKSVFAILFAASSVAVSVVGRIVVCYLPNSNPGNSLFSFILGLCVPVLISVATVLYTVESEKTSDTTI